ncbi:hypothetical protein ILUMI_13484 [Ignelater luminosus]|uniref:Peptidase S1 domain-containing protein n=1 Tax=Ignelater luminosus TaxID=2038154 RepID=A0A8K0CYH3_IGNLU|nr:hypothetical protein ILUMI_13484 [Ignelater luminosus]
MIRVAFIFCAIFINVFALPALDKEINNLDWRVVGGSTAPDGAYPYQVSIQDSETNSHGCGGSIIKPTIILTAAHCVVGISSSKFSVVVGINKLDEEGTAYKVKDVRSHDNYNPFTVENDIAILKLSSPIEYNSKVAPVELEESEVDDGTEAALSGWGSTSWPGSSPNDLQHIILKTISNSDCKASHPSKQIFDSQICTFTKRGEGSCYGDSGGPLVSEKSKKQIGIVSWGRPCGIGYPDVFTKVAAFKEWIKIHSH